MAPDPGIWQFGWFGAASGLGVTKPITGPINLTENSCYDAAHVKPGPSGVGLTVTSTRARCSGHVRPFSGAMMSTNPDDGRLGGGYQFRYGIVQARMYLPGLGRGPKVANWPVFMTVGQPSNYGEDDIVEGLDGSVCAHYHSAGAKGYVGIGGCDHVLGPGWHTFTADWEPGSITWYYDGKRYLRVTKDIASGPEYIVLGNTTASDWPATNKPDTMTVAWVRVFQRAPLGK